MIQGFIYLQVAIMALVTLLLRAIPFFIFRNKKETPEFIVYLGNMLPMAIMGMLVVYCLKGVTFAVVSEWLPVMVSVLSVIALHVWKRNTLLSILGGTVLYMFLIHLF